MDVPRPDDGQLTEMLWGVGVDPEPVAARPSASAEREWRRAARAREREREVRLSVAGGAVVMGGLLVAASVGVTTDVPGAGLALALIVGLLPVFVLIAIVASAVGRTALTVSTGVLGEPAYAQLLANDAPRRWRRHAAELGDHEAVMFATRAVERDDALAVELVAFRPVAREWARDGDGWRAATSRADDRFWVLGVVERVEIGEDDHVRLGEQLAVLEERARALERAALDGLRRQREDERTRQADDAERVAARRGLAAGVNAWQRDA